MDNIIKFLNSIYLGDRFCEKIEIREGKILFQVNCISRLKDGIREWDYYSEKDIEHGYLVFDDVVDFCWGNELIINDEIYEIEVVGKKDEVYSFVVHGCNVSDDAISIDTDLQIKAKKFYILNPRDGSIITE